MLKLMSPSRSVTLLAAFLLPAALGAQDAPPPAVARIVVEPASLTLRVGDSVGIKATAYDAQGNAISVPSMRIGAPRNALQVSRTGVTALAAGDYEITYVAVTSATPEPVRVVVPVKVTWPRPAEVTVAADPGRLYTGVTLAFRAHAKHADGSARPNEAITWVWRSSNPAVASVDRFGYVTAHRAGPVTISAEAEGVRAEARTTVAVNPVRSIKIDLADARIRTGDVIHLKATARTAAGAPVADAPITWSYTYVPDDTIAAPGATGVVDRGLFTAEVPGRYTLLATTGNVSARAVLEAAPREARRRITVTGRGTVTNVHTSDFWPYTGRDGKDYALVGTWGGDGWAYVMDLTDLGNIAKVDSVKVDARIINDVTVSPDARYGVLSREGASNRQNGVVLLDLADPAHPKIAATFTQELTGGVHNMFATNDYLFAISGGERYVIVDVRDLYHPKYAGQYDHPNSYVHDVWVRDGIAYSSEWGTGVVAVDVGNGKWGGSVEHPKLIGTFPTTSGATHEVYPYFQKATGKLYLFLGDEIMSREGRAWEGTNYFQDLFGAVPKKGGVPQTSAGYTHIIDFTDPEHPVNIARYQQEEFGAHDIIVEDDVLYQAYYDGGVRIVDVSGELVGNLATQGREIAVYKPFDPNGYTPNASFVMNAMPWKGHVLFTDFNSGLWAAKLEPRKGLTP